MMIRRNFCVFLGLALSGWLLAAASPAAWGQDFGNEGGGQAREGRGEGRRGGGFGRNRGQESEGGEEGGRFGRRGGLRGDGAGGRGPRREERPAGAAGLGGSAPAPANTAPPPASSNRGFGSGGASRTSGFGSNSPASLPPSGAVAAGAATNADAMLKRFDTLKPDGVLDAEELARSRFINLKPADRNNDGRVTKEELIAWYVARAQGGGAAPSAPATASTAPATAGATTAALAAGSTVTTSPAPPNSSSSARASVGDSGPAEPQRKSYRFLSATERLPSGLPSWFRDKDRDRDGQVLMSEWTSQWSDSAVNEFSRHDRNGDGVITPSEALRSGG